MALLLDSWIFTDELLLLVLISCSDAVKLLRFGNFRDRLYRFLDGIEQRLLFIGVLAGVTDGQLVIYEFLARSKFLHVFLQCWRDIDLAGNGVITQFIGILLAVSLMLARAILLQLLKS